MKVSIVGASGYGGGELLRLLLKHPQVEVHQCTSERFVGKPVTRLHPNLHKRTNLKFCSIQDLDAVDLIFTALPHTRCMQKFAEFSSLAPRIVDLSADFRLKDADAYRKCYGVDHTQPDQLDDFVYGNVELHREEMKPARYISGAGCNATATILPLWPLFKQGVVDTTQPAMAEAKCGSSEGGVRIGDKDYFQKVRQICDANGILLIIDEVQTGFGRTGTMFACEQFVEPDMLCLAKSLAGGIPMGAVLCNDRIKVPVKSHTSTFGGNPTACAAALASVDVIEKEGLVAKSKTLGEYFLHELRTLESSKIREVRGLGLMLGIELKEKAGPYVHKLMEKGVIVLLAGATVIRLLPPLVITKEEIDRVLGALKETLGA